MDVEEDLMIYGDPDKLARVFDNILRNAIAYCYADTEIRIEAKMKDGDIEIIFTNAVKRFRRYASDDIQREILSRDGSRSKEPAAQVWDLRSPNRSWSCTEEESWQKVMTTGHSLS